MNTPRINTPSRTQVLHRLMLAWVAALALITLAACHDDESSTATAITAQPTDQSVVAGTTATFGVVASNATSYQWQSSTDSGSTFADVSGATSASYTTAVTTFGDSGTQYRVVVSGADNNVTSSAVTLTVTAVGVAPGISVQPAGQTITEGQDVSFSVTASGTSLGYQWQRSTDDGANFADVAGETGATLTLTAVPLANDAHQFRVVVSNSADSVTSNAALLTVNPAPAIPAFTTQPASIAVVAPGTASFNVTVTGIPSPTLQWQLSTNGGSSFVDIAGATGSSYTTPATGAGDDGNQYRIIATNGSGASTSDAATLTITVPAVPSFTTQPSSATITEGQDAQFTVAVSGTPTPTLQWQLSIDSGGNWSNINGATNTILDLTGVALVDNGRQFRAVASNTEGSTNSNAATLTVTAAPAIKAWQTAERVSPDIDGDVYNYQIAYSSNGDAIAVWQDLVSASIGTNIWANRYTPSTGWGTPTLIDSGDGNAQVPQVALDENGNAIAVWEQDGMPANCCGYTRYDIWANRYVPGTGWEGAVLLETIDGVSNERGASQPQIAMAANGQAVVAWGQGDASSGSSIWANRYVTGSWTGASLVENATGIAGGPKVAMDASGNEMVVWVQSNGTQLNLWASRNSGASEQIETASAGNPSSLQVASNASGETVAVWGQGCVTWANRFAPGAGWGTATSLQTGSPSCAYIPNNQVAIDTSGNAIAAWVLNTGASITTYINRYSAGVGWLGASPINYGGGNFQFAMNATGDTLGTWKSSTILAGNDAYVSGYSFASSVQVFGGSGLDTTGLKIAMDASGNAIVLFKRAEVAGVRNTVWASVYK